MFMMIKPNFKVEAELYDKGLGAIAGIDEAGRGPLAGPVVAGAVILESSGAVAKELIAAGLRDSKTMTEKARERLFELIAVRAESWAVGEASAVEIDAINILQATFLAMRRAIEGLSVSADFLVVDGRMTIPRVDLAQKCFHKGDRDLVSIAAAAVMAKVTRDRLMKKYAEDFPSYGFDRHKGYGTAAHLSALQQFGPCSIHRRSFAPVRECL